jgi:hypothetical protein
MAAQTRYRRSLADIQDDLLQVATPPEPSKNTRIIPGQKAISKKPQISKKTFGTKSCIDGLDGPRRAALVASVSRYKTKQDAPASSSITKITPKITPEITIEEPLVKTTTIQESETSKKAALIASVSRYKKELEAQSLSSTLKTTPKIITKKPVAKRDTSKKAAPIVSVPTFVRHHEASILSSSTITGQTMAFGAGNTASKKTAPTASVLTSKEKPKHSFSPTRRVLDGGPNGPPVYDTLGYELDHDKVARSTFGRPKKIRSMAAYEREEKRWEKTFRDEDRKAEIMGGPPKCARSALTYFAWDDRVSRELGIPYYKVEMKDFEELARRGFKGQEGEFEAKDMTEEERDRLSTLATGSALRK